MTVKNKLAKLIPFYQRRQKVQQLKSKLEDKKALIDKQAEKIDDYEEYIKEGAVLITIPPIAPIPKDFSHLHYTLVRLANPHYYEDHPDMEFEKVVLITRRPYEKEFHFGSLELYLGDGALVKGQAAACWFVRIAYTPDDIPILYCSYSERDAEEGLIDVIVTTSEIKSIREKVLEKMYRHMVDKFLRADTKIKTAEALGKAAENTTVKLQKDIEEKLLLNRTATEDEINNARKGIFLRTWQTLVLGAGWAVAIILTGILLGVIV
jgi:hypothetical protein